MSSDFIYIGKLGKTIGLSGEQKIHHETDFPEQFKKGNLFFLDKKTPLTVETFNIHKSSIKFLEINSIEEATKLINKELFTTMDDSRKYCKLNKGQYFWFDLLGLEVIENGQILGIVKDITRYTNTNYFEIDTNNELISTGLPKTFLIPYIENYIEQIDIQNKKLLTKNSFDILANS